MGKANIPAKVRLICAVCYPNKQAIESATELLIHNFGCIGQSSLSYKFTYTDYYRMEMGQGLQKVFYSFTNLIDPVSIVDAKLITNDIEIQLSHTGRRTVNLDPGYIEAAKLVLATTKNFGHRIYLGKGIYGDVQLYFKKGGFHTNDWTYPDYKTEQSIEFFEKVRREYLSFLQKRK